MKIKTTWAENLSDKISILVQNRFKKFLMARGIFVGRAKNIDEYKISADILQKNGVTIVLDVGANRGQYGFGLRSAGYLGDIFSFEPDPSVFRELTGAIKNDQKWNALNIALTDNDEQFQEFNVSSNAGYSSSLLSGTNNLKLIYSNISFDNKLFVECRNFNSVLLQFSSKGALFVKADIQGFEKRLFESIDFNEYPNILGIMIEVSLVTLYEQEWEISEAIKYFTESGFSLYAISCEDYSPKFGTTQVNLFFEKKSRSALHNN